MGQSTNVVILKPFSNTQLEEFEETFEHFKRQTLNMIEHDLIKIFSPSPLGRALYFFLYLGGAVFSIECVEYLNLNSWPWLIIIFLAAMLQLTVDYIFILVICYIIGRYKLDTKEGTLQTYLSSLSRKDRQLEIKNRFLVVGKTRLKRKELVGKVENKNFYGIIYMEYFYLVKRPRALCVLKEDLNAIALVNKFHQMRP